MKNQSKVRYRTFQLSQEQLGRGDAPERAPREDHRQHVLALEVGHPADVRRKLHPPLHVAVRLHSSEYQLLVLGIVRSQLPRIWTAENLRRHLTALSENDMNHNTSPPYFSSES